MRQCAVSIPTTHYFKAKEKRKMIKKDRVGFNIMAYILITALAIFCVAPFILVISGSFSEEKLILRQGFGFLPKGFSLESYRTIFRNPSAILRAYGVTILLTALGSFLSLFLVSMTAYTLLRKSLRSRNFFALFFYFTTLFSGGLVPWYILMLRYLNMKNSFLALLLPPLFSVFDLIIMRTFMKGIPDSLCESAKLDGANEFIIYARIYIPLSLPALATIGLFVALRYWNDWSNAMLFIGNDSLYPLQFFLYRVLNSMEGMRMAAEKAGLPMPQMPTQTFKLAMTMVATGPILLLYPFIQKYFIKGITIGAVKG
jgi:putative aldouronate transport system permease protein